MYSVTSLWEWKPTSGASLFHQLCLADSISFIHPLLDSHTKIYFFKFLFFLSFLYIKIATEVQLGSVESAYIYACVLFNQNTLTNVHIHQETFCFISVPILVSLIFLTTAILTMMFHCALICISMIINGVDHLFHAPVAICVLLREMLISMQFLCLFFDQKAFFFAIELYEFFIYFV